MSAPHTGTRSFAFELSAASSTASHCSASGSPAGVRFAFVTLDHTRLASLGRIGFAALCRIGPAFLGPRFLCILGRLIFARLVGDTPLV